MDKEKGMFQIIEANENYYRVNWRTGVDWSWSIGYPLIKDLRQKEFTSITELVDMVTPLLEVKPLKYRMEWKFENSLTPSQYFFRKEERFFKFEGQDVVWADGGDVNRWQNGREKLYAREVCIRVLLIGDLEGNLNTLKEQGVKISINNIF